MKTLSCAIFLLSMLMISLFARPSIEKDSVLKLLELSKSDWEKGRLEEAEFLLDEVKKQLALKPSDSLKATYFQYRGLIEHEKGNYEIAAGYFIKGLALYERLEDEEGIAQCYNNMGSVYWQMEELDKAKENFEKYAKLREEKGDLKGLASVYGNVGLIYRAKGEYDLALDYYQKSLSLFEQLGKKFNVGINLQNIGSLYHKQEKYDKARDYFQQTLNVCKEIDDQIGVLYALHSLASVDIALGEYQKGIEGLKEALKMAESVNVKEEIKNLYLALAEAYYKSGKYKSAIDNRILFETWKDSLIGEKHLNQVKELELAYETEKKERQISLLKQENKIQALENATKETWNKALTFGLILLFIIAGLIFYSFRQKLKAQKLISQKDIELKETHFQRALIASEMIALRAQMNPHFIFNCLNSINRMILSGDEENASRYLTKFSRLLRRILENAEKPTISIEEELKSLIAYVELESLRFKEKIDLKLDIASDIEKETTYIPGMLLQPIIENSIWHGLRAKEKGGLISISLKLEEDKLNCKIEDNGIGRAKAKAIQKESSLKSRSLGLKITRERLALLSNGYYSNSLKIIDLKDSLNKAIGTRVEIALPIS